MAIDRTGISSLQTGAPDIKYTGNQGPRSPDQMLMASADPMLVEEYNKYVFEMEEQGLQPMSFREFMEQAMSGMAYGGTAKPTYTQSRKQRMAYGGVAGLDGRKRYGAGSWYQENIKDPLEKAFTGKSQTQIDNESQLRVDREQSINRPLPPDFDITRDRVADITPIGDPQGTGPYTPWYEEMFAPAGEKLEDTLTQLLPGDQGIGQNLSVNDILNVFGLGTKHKFLDKDILPDPYLKTMTKERVAGQDAKPIYGQDGETIVGYSDPIAAQAAEYETKVNPFYPIAGGMAAHEYARAHPGPTLPADTAIGARNIDMAAATRGDNLRFGLNPLVAAAQGGIARLAQGGRIGYRNGNDVDPDDPLHEVEPLIIPDDADISPDDFYGKKEKPSGIMMASANPSIWLLLLKELEGTITPEELELLEQLIKERGKDSLPFAQGGRIGYSGGGNYANRLSELIKKANAGTITPQEEHEMEQLQIMLDYGPGEKDGGRIGAQEGGLMDLGGMEKDYREEG